MTESGRIDPEQTVVRAQPGPIPPAQAPSAQPVPTAQAPLPARARSDQPKKESRFARIWSNLNLNGPVPARVRPAIGEWGPQALPSTKAKKRGRWIAPLAFLAALVLLILVGWFFMTLFR